MCSCVLRCNTGGSDNRTHYKRSFIVFLYVSAGNCIRMHCNFPSNFVVVFHVVFLTGKNIPFYHRFEFTFRIVLWLFKNHCWLQRTNCSVDYNSSLLWFERQMYNTVRFSKNRLQFLSYCHHFNMTAFVLTVRSSIALSAVGITICASWVRFL